MSAKDIFRQTGGISQGYFGCIGLPYQEGCLIGKTTDTLYVMENTRSLKGVGETCRNFMCRRNLK